MKKQSRQEKLQQAAEIVGKAEALGCKPELQGDWVVFRPPLPVDLLMLAMNLGNELAEVVITGRAAGDGTAKGGA